MVFYIEKQVKMCYHIFMENFFEYKAEYNDIAFQLTNKSVIDEREIHSYHELLLYISGDAEFLSTDGQRGLKERSVLLIPRETYHFFKPKGSFTRLKISFQDDGLLPDGDGISFFEDLHKNTAHAFERLCAVIKDNSNKRNLYVYSAFLMLMTELEVSGCEGSGALPKAPSTLMTAVTDYVSENLSGDLSIKALAERFHVSSSGITHQFKKELGISLHKYVMQKRLILAQRMVSEGKQLSKSYAELGFSDYSSLYKAYVKYFGVPPVFSRCRSRPSPY